MLGFSTETAQFYILSMPLILSQAPGSGEQSFLLNNFFLMKRAIFDKKNVLGRDDFSVHGYMILLKTPIEQHTPHRVRGVL
jgi:hypothetical protein